MSAISLQDVRAYLRVTQQSDDVLLQLLLDDAEDEALEYLNRTTLPRKGETIREDFDSNTRPEPVSDSDDLAGSVRSGIFLIVQAMYERADNSTLAAARESAEIKWFPYRVGLGV